MEMESERNTHITNDNIDNVTYICFEIIGKGTAIQPYTTNRNWMTVQFFILILYTTTFSVHAIIAEIISASFVRRRRTNNEKCLHLIPLNSYIGQ